MTIEEGEFLVSFGILIEKKNSGNTQSLELSRLLFI